MPPVGRTLSQACSHTTRYFTRCKSQPPPQSIRCGLVRHRAVRESSPSLDRSTLLEAPRLSTSHVNRPSFDVRGPAAEHGVLGPSACR